MTELNHLDEEQLLWFYYGENSSADAELHVAICPRCSRELQRLKAEMAAIDTYAPPTPPPDYEDRVWRALVRRDASLTARPAWWRRWWSPRRLALAGALASAILAAFLAGRFTSVPPPLVSAEAARERHLVAALSDHLEQSERMLVEIHNLALGDERQQAEQLLAANRLYRQTAARQGQVSLAATLEDLERLLLDVAHAPGPKPSAVELREWQARVEEQGLLFKVQVLGSRLRESVERPLPVSPARLGVTPSRKG